MHIANEWNSSASLLGQNEINSRKNRKVTRLYMCGINFVTHLNLHVIHLGSKKLKGNYDMASS